MKQNYMRGKRLKYSRYSEEHLRKISYQRLKRYYAAVKAHYFKAKHGWVWDIEATENELDSWYRYLMFVKAIKSVRENEEETA